MNIRNIGLVLAILGGLGLAFQTFSIPTNTESIELGPIEASYTEEETVTIPAIAAGAVLVLGLGMTIFGSKSSKG